MFRKENLAAFSLVGLLFSLAVAYAFARFIMPWQTEVPSGLLNFDRETIPLFNVRAFFLVFPIVQALVVLVHLLNRSWLWAGVEAGLILLYVIVGRKLSIEVFAVSETSSGPLGFNEITTTSFRTDLLLLLAVLTWALASVVRLLADTREPEKHRIAQPGWRLLLLAAGWVATGAYFIGIHVPVFHSVRFWLFEEQVSLVQSVDAFFHSGEVFIGVVVLTFTLVFPVIKLIYMFWALLAVPSKWSEKVNKVLSVLGKYSMLDVFVLALLLLNLKFDSDLIDMELRDGVIWFAVSILLNMGVASFLVSRSKS